MISFLTLEIKSVFKVIIFFCEKKKLLNKYC